VLILLPPSEGKAVPRRGRPLDLTGLSFGELTGARERVLEALVSLTERDDAAAVLGLGATQADLVGLDARLRTSPTVRAERLYTGVLYDALGLTTLTPVARRRAASRAADQPGGGAPHRRLRAPRRPGPGPYTRLRALSSR